MITENIVNKIKDLEKRENSKYSTENGVKEFKCKDGYIDNIYLEGKTLVNLYSNISYSNSDEYEGTCIIENNGITISCTSGLEYTTSTNTINFDTNKEYTFIFDIEFQGSSCEIHEFVNGVHNRVIYNLNNSISGNTKFKYIPSGENIYFRFDANTSGTTVKFKNIMIIEGDLTDKNISYFEGLKSVDKIEVLSFKTSNNLIPSNLTWTNNYYTESISGELITIEGMKTCNEFIKIEGGKTYTFYDINGQVALYDVNKQLIPIHHNDLNPIRIRTKNSIYNDNFILTLPNNVDYIKINVATNTNRIVEPCISLGCGIDNKTVSTTLRSVPNGIKDTIEKRGNKYYKIKRCGEVTLNGGESVTSIHSPNNNTGSLYRRYGIKISETPKNGRVFCDKLNSKLHYEIEERNIFSYSTGDCLFITIENSALTDINAIGITDWLRTNPITVVYELETPIIEELPNFNPQTFEGDTTLIINSGAIQLECDFEVTNSMGSELEVLKDKVSDNDNILFDINSEIISYADKQYSSLNDVPLKPGRYGINCTDDSFPLKYGNLTIDYGSFNKEYIATFRGIGSGNYISSMWISINRNHDINDKGWKAWEKVTTDSTLSELEQQVSELEIQLLEREV